MQLHATPIGEGRPRMMFLHGFLGQGKNFTTVARGLEPLGASLLVDLPNHGRSPWTDSFRYAAMADAVAALIADRLAGGSLTVIGHSMGGKVAMALALRHPGLVRGLVVVDIAPDDSGAGYGFSEIVDALTAVDTAALRHRDEADRALSAGVPDQGVRAFLLQSLRHRQDRSGLGWQFNLELLSRSLPDVSGWPSELDGRYDGPVLWIRGGDSDYVGEQHYAAMMRLFPETALLTVEDAGHWVHAERPRAVIEGLRNFLLANRLVPAPPPHPTRDLAT